MTFCILAKLKKAVQHSDFKEVIKLKQKWIIKVGTFFLILMLVSACNANNDDGEGPTDKNDPDVENQSYDHGEPDLNDDSRKDDQNENIQNNREEKGIPYNDRKHQEHNPNKD